MKLIRSVTVLCLLAWSCTGCSTPHNHRQVLFQTSTMQALMNGVYDGDLSLGELARHGDFGLGTFDALEGEMIALDGTFYQIKADGQVYPVAATMTTPFAAVTFFKPDRSIAITAPLDYRQLATVLEGLRATPNLPYVIKIDGDFTYVKARSVPRQQQPYPPLLEAVKNQSVFEFHNIRGVLVGFLLPPYLEGVNVPGFHFHFITLDRRAGGHLLDCRLRHGEVMMAPLTRFSLRLPGNKEFFRTDLTRKRPQEMEKVEK